MQPRNIAPSRCTVLYSGGRAPGSAPARRLAEAPSPPRARWKEHGWCMSRIPLHAMHTLSEGGGVGGSNSVYRGGSGNCGGGRSEFERIAQANWRGRKKIQRIQQAKWPKTLANALSTPVYQTGRVGGGGRTMARDGLSGGFGKAPCVISTRARPIASSFAALSRLRRGLSSACRKFPLSVVTTSLNRHVQLMLWKPGGQIQGFGRCCRRPRSLQLRCAAERRRLRTQGAACLRLERWYPRVALAHKG